MRDKVASLTPERARSMHAMRRARRSLHRSLHHVMERRATARHTHQPADPAPSLRAAASDSLLTSEDRTGDEAVECAMGNSTVPAAAAPSGPESPTGVTKKAFAGKSAICATAQVRTVNPGPADGAYP